MSTSSSVDRRLRFLIFFFPFKIKVIFLKFRPTAILQVFPLNGVKTISCNLGLMWSGETPPRGGWRDETQRPLFAVRNTLVFLFDDSYKKKKYSGSSSSSNRNALFSPHSRGSSRSLSRHFEVFFAQLRRPRKRSWYRSPTVEIHVFFSAFLFFPPVGLFFSVIGRRGAVV